MLTAALTEIRRLSSRYMNEDTPGEEHAAEALEAGRAAYWSTTGSTNALSLWRDYVNIAGAVGDGLAAYRKDFGSKLAGDVRLIKRFLDKLIPLNDAAVADLDVAYRTLAGTWVEDDLRERAFNFDALSERSGEVTGVLANV